jgi:hypothetical protein
MTSVETVRASECDSEQASELLNVVESKLGVVIGESLADDIEGCGEELVLRRACALGGGWPNEKVEVIRSSDEGLRNDSGELYALDHPIIQGANGSKRRDELGCALAIAQTRTQGGMVVWLYRDSKSFYQSDLLHRDRGLGGRAAKTRRGASNVPRAIARQVA